jgi:hypothetical protein
MKAFTSAWTRALITVLIGSFFSAVLAAKDKPPTQYQIPIPAAPDFTTLDWLLGKWTGKTLPPSAPGSLQLTVSSDLEKHFLVIHGEVSLDASGTVPATKWSWMGIINPDGPQFILHEFSSTGFVTRYRLIFDGAEIRFNPEGGDALPPGWLFRKSWSRTATDEFTETVQAAPPGRSFFDYYTARFSHVPPPPVKANSATPTKTSPATADKTSAPPADKSNSAPADKTNPPPVEKTNPAP